MVADSPGGLFYGRRMGSQDGSQIRGLDHHGTISPLSRATWDPFFQWSNLLINGGLHPITTYDQWKPILQVGRRIPEYSSLPARGFLVLLDVMMKLRI